MPSFSPKTYANLISERSAAQAQLFAQYTGGDDVDVVVVVGSGMGGGILADRLADQLTALGRDETVLLLEAGSYLFPTHVFNVCRFPNAQVAARFGVRTFTQPPDGENGEFFLREQPQLNLGGRSVFWSGLIPSIQPWELEFLPPAVRAEVSAHLDAAGEVLNESRTLGAGAEAIVEALRASPLAADFDIQQTPRALHQPYLQADGEPRDAFWLEPTGVFNTAELVINQVGPPDSPAAGRPLHILLNHYVESVTARPEGGYRLHVQNTVDATARTFTAQTVVLAGGTLESPKILRRSPVFDDLTAEVRELVGRGLTDHPTTAWVNGRVTRTASGVPIPRDCHAKIILYSRGGLDGGAVRYPFNVEMNINHEYWHLRENDADAPAVPLASDGASRMQIKFSFGNCLDDDNHVEFNDAHVPHVLFRNLLWTDDLVTQRFPALAGWPKRTDPQEVFAVLRDVVTRIFAQFRDGDAVPIPMTEDFGQPFQIGLSGPDVFGHGTVHHAVGTLRMPARPSRGAPFADAAVVNEDLQVRNHERLYVCDMSVLPFSSAANPVRTLAALALRLADQIVADLP